MKLIFNTLFICIICYSAAPAFATPQDNPPTEEIWLSTLDVSRVEQGWGEAHSKPF